MRCILHQQQVMLPGQCAQWIEIECCPGKMHRHDQARALIHQGFNQARALATKRIQKYRRQLKGGRPLAIPTFQGVLSYQAVVTGLRRENALAACRYMLKKGRYCVVMPPAVGRMNVKRGRLALKIVRKRSQ